MSDQVDVCIIGGGIMGLFCALELSQSGKVVRIVDKLFTGSSRHNIGAVLFQVSNEDRLPFLKMTHDAWDAAGTDNDIDMGFEKRGSAFFAYAKSMAKQLESEAEHDAKHGFKGVSYEEDTTKLREFLDVENIPEEILGAKVSDEDNIVDTGKALDALRQLLIRNGVRFWGSDEVTEFKIEGNKIISVKTKTGEECTAKEFIVTAGVWANKLLQLVDISIPMRPARCHLLHISPNGKVPNRLIAKQFPTGDIIIKYQRSGQVLVSYTGAMDQAQATWSNEVDEEAVAWVMEQLPTMLTGLSAPILNKVTTVILAITQDGCPFIGRVEKYENLTVALGFSGKSYAYSAGVAKAVKSIILGEDCGVDLAPFKVGREMKLPVTSLGQDEEEMVTIIGAKPEDDSDITTIIGAKPEDDPDATMEVGDKPDGDQESSMETGDKPEADGDITMTVGDKPSDDSDVTMELGDKPADDDGISMELGDKPTEDTGITMEVGEKPDADSEVSMEVEGGTALAEQGGGESSFVTEGDGGSALGGEDGETNTKLTVEGETALGEEEGSSFESEGDEDTALGKNEKDPSKMVVEGESALTEQGDESSFVTEGEDGSALGKEDESKAKLTVEGKTALGEKEENTSAFVSDGNEGSALGKEGEDDSTMVVEGESALEDTPEKKVEMHVDGDEKTALGTKKPKKAKGKLKVDDSSNLGLGAKPKEKKSSLVQEDENLDDAEEEGEVEGVDLKEDSENNEEAPEEEKKDKLTRGKSKIVYDEPVKKKRQQKIVYD